MQVNIRVTAHARRNAVEPQSDGTLRVYTTAAATDGQANSAVIKMLAAHFNVPKTSIKIIRGQTARDKVIEF
ncbi:MAG: DUF167 domain-containing protein [Alphaproteobacteria bacterium]|nr:DUF167 domain-containing protein [Alphaproteobacteria bacterium]